MPSSGGGIALVAHGSHGCATSATSCAISFTPTNVGDLLVVGVSAGLGTPSISVTDNATGGSCTYSQAYQITQSGGAGERDGVFYCLSSKSGTTTITPAWSGNNTATVVVAEFSGSAGGFDVAVSALNSGTGTAATANSITTTVANDVVIGFANAHSIGSATYSTSGSWTFIDGVNEGGNNTGSGMSYQVVGAAAGYTAAITLSSSLNWWMGAASFKH